MAAALALSDPIATAERQEFVSRAMSALEARDFGEALELAEEAKKVRKDTLIVNIRALAAALGEQARAAARAGEAADMRRADVAAARHALALATMRQLGANAAVQLATEAMLLKMREA
jgi:hypothetical protein